MRSLRVDRNSPRGIANSLGVRHCHFSRTSNLRRWQTTVFFMIRSRLMDRGSRRPTTDTSGNPWSYVKRTGDPTHGVVGFVATGAGRGCRRSPLAGRLITTGGGPCCVDVDGSGCQVRSGHLAGSHGVKMPITSAGHRYRPRLSPTVVKAGALVWTCSSISVRRGLTSSE